jgi:hypothetical protein
VATGEIFSEVPEDIEKLVDPLKWEIRRVLVELANDPSLAPEASLQAASIRLGRELERKFTRIASVNRNIDVQAEISRRIEAFHQFAQSTSSDQQFVAEARSRIRNRLSDRIHKA